MSEKLALALKYAPQGIALFNAAIFLDSLRYKFTDHPKTQEIFGRLDSWAASVGFPGLFGHTGVFSQYVIGAGELAASVFLLVGAFYAPYRFLLPIGALIGLAIMSGAIGFHLFTPLGVDPNQDGGGLFKSACLVWMFSGALALLRARDFELLGARVLAFAAPA
ncbi:MAG: hypothetical protein GC189_03965 [Alphaproteobacteria bacterium]|nr:hypothetical protein [Alphaproteobacteria bacterium]